VQRLPTRRDGRPGAGGRVAALDAVVVGVGHEDIARRVGRDLARVVELTVGRAGGRPAERRQPHAVRRELLHAVVRRRMAGACG
jgi:hypothetical protein